MNKLKLLTDEALCEKTSHRDGLGFSRYAKILGDAAVGTEGPFTIGVFGEWGTGKTSLMRLIQAHLKKEYSKQVVTVWFNAWQFAKEEHAIIPLIATIIKEIEKQIEAKAGVVEHLKNGGRELMKSLRAILYGLSVNAKAGVPGVTEVEVSASIKDMIDRFEGFSADPLLNRSLYFDAFAQLEDAKDSTPLQVVVIIDDLDRCLPDSAITLLESIKLIFSQKGFTFIIGVARKIIEGYLTHRYKENYGIHDFQGHSYLDKIVQLPFHLPSHRLQMDEYKNHILSRINPEFTRDIEDIFPTIVVASDNNPRAIIRFINNILIDAAIQESQLEQSGGTARIPLFYFAVTRCLQAEWSDVFNRLINDDELCALIPHWDEKDNLAEIAKLESKSHAFIAERLLQDRNLHDLLRSVPGKEWLRKSGLRHATIEFLKTERDDPVSLPDEPFQTEFPVTFIVSDDESGRFADGIAHASVLGDLSVSVLNSGDDYLRAVEVLSQGLRVLFIGKQPHPEWLSGFFEHKHAFGAPSIDFLVFLPGANSTDAAIFNKDRQARPIDMRDGKKKAGIKELTTLLRDKVQERILARYSRSSK